MTCESSARTEPAAAVIGFSASALNAVVLVFHKATFPGSPGPFQGEVKIGDLGVKSATWSIPQAPVIDLSPKHQSLDKLREEVRSTLSDFPHAEEWAESMLADSVMLGASADGVEVTLTLDSGDSRKITGSLSGVLMATIAPGNQIVFQVHGAQFTPEHSDPGIKWILEHVLVPTVQAELNKTFSNGFPFTPFENSVIQFSAPQIAIADGALVAYAARDSTAVPTLPAGLSWPASRGQYLLDTETWAAGVSAMIKARHMNKSGHFGVDKKLFKMEVTYQGGATSGRVLGRAAKNLINGALALSGGGHLVIQVLIKIKVGLTLSAAPDIDVKVESSGGFLRPSIDKVNSLNLKVDFSLPGLIKYLFDLIFKALFAAFTKLIEKGIKSLKLDSIEIPTMILGYENTEATVSGTDVEVVEVKPHTGPHMVGFSAVPTASRNQNLVEEEMK